METSSGAIIDAIDSGVTDSALVVRWLSKERSEYLSGLSDTTFAFPIASGVDNFLVKSGTSVININSFNSGVEDFNTTTSFNAQPNVTWEVDQSNVLSGVSTVLQSGVVNVFDEGSNTPTSSGVRNIKYQVQIPFKLSKVAPSSGVWNVGIMVHDRLQQEIAIPRTDVVEDHYAFALGGYGNQWYGEVSIVSQDDKISFTNVAAGSGFQLADQSGVTSGIQVRFISNGTYNQQVQSDTTWNPTTTIPTRPAFAYLVFNSGLEVTSGDSLGRLDGEGNRFALQARRLLIEGDNGDDPTDFVDILPAAVPTSNDDLIPLKTDEDIYRLADANQVPQDEAKASVIRPISSAEGTTEAGVVSTFEFQLRLSAVFQKTTYNGNKSIGVTN